MVPLIKDQIINEGYPKDITFELISNIDTTIEDISEWNIKRLKRLF